MNGAESSPGKVLDVARRILSRRDHGISELARKLKARGFAPSQIQNALKELEAGGYLDDTRCSRALLESELGRGHGLAYVRAKLRQRGLPSSDDPSDLQAEAESLRLFVRRKNLLKSTLTGNAERAKILRFLRGRGYTASAIVAVLGPLAEEEQE